MAVYLLIVRTSTSSSSRKKKKKMLEMFDVYWSTKKKWNDLRTVPRDLKL